MKKTNFNKICAVSLILIATGVVLHLTSNFATNIFASADDNQDWIHYSAIEPTLNTAGIKEYYVSCTSHQHRFIAPSRFTEGTWTQSKKQEIYSDTNDDRRIMSFNEIDNSLEDITGSNPYDFLSINSTIDYIEDNYSENAQNSYIAQSNLAYDLEANYEMLFEKIFDMNDASYYANNTNFSVSKGSDDSYGATLDISISKDFSNTNPSFSLNNFNAYFSTGLDSISFAIYSSETTQVNFGLLYSDSTAQYVAFPLTTGWNHFTYAKGTTYYNYFTNAAENAKTLTKLVIVMVQTHHVGNEIRLASYIGKNAKTGGDMLKSKIAKLPTKANLTAYEISNINNLLAEYSALDATEKAKVTNYSVLQDLKNYWDSLYVLLYDMNASYVGLNSNATLTKNVIFNKTYGYVLDVKVTAAGTYIDINNITNAYTTIELSKIEYMLKPSVDCFMSWSNLANYGRQEWDNGVKQTDMPMLANTWTEFVIQGERSTGDNIEQFMTYINGHNSTRNDFVPTNDRWGHYLVADVGFEYQMSSIIGVKAPTAANILESKINGECSGTPSIDKIKVLNEIEETFNSFSTEDKEKVSNIEKYYDYKNVYSQSFPYLINPDVDLLSKYQTANVTNDDIQKGVATDYGYAYKITYIKQNYGTNFSFKYNFGNTVDNNGFYIYVKGTTNPIKLCSHAPTYGVDIETAVRTDAGNGWSKYSFSKNAYDAIMAIDGCEVAYCMNGNNAIGTEFYMSGTFYVPVTNGDDRATVQAHINTVNDLPNEEFLGAKITEVQNEIYALPSVEQLALTGIGELDSKYAQYKAKYANVYSMGVYRVGQWWNGAVSNIQKSYDVNYGDIYSVTSTAGQSPYITIGCWELSGTKGSHRGYGRAISPLQSGKYNSVSFAIYMPYNPNGSSASIAAWDDGDTTFSIMSKSLVQGWNKITFTGDSLNKLCGTSGSFKGLSIALPSQSSSYEFKVTSFIGEKNQNYTGASEYYADSLHLGAYNIESTDYMMFGAGTSSYKIVANDNQLTNDAVGFMNNILNKKIGTTLGVVSSANPSEHSRYIFLNNASAMAAMNIDLPSEDDIGSTGYSITTVGSSVYIYAYDREGYELAAAKFLEATIGYDWMANDMLNFEKNGTIFNKSVVINTPDFAVVERPDFDDRYHSNYPINHTYGSNLEQTDIYNPNCCNVTHFLDTSTYKYCYYSTGTSSGSSLQIDDAVLCFNGGSSSLHDGYAARRQTMIQVIGDKIIENDQLNLGYKYAAVFQGDTSKTCDCKRCKSDKSTYGSDSAPVVKFMNDLDDYIKAHYTTRDIKLTFLAYNKTLKAPSNGLTCHEDVVPFIAPSGARWNHSFYEVENSSGVGENGYTYDNDFAQNIQDWSNVCSDYVLWAYQVQNGDFLYPYNTFESMYMQYRFFKNNGCYSISNEGATASATSGFATLKDYLDSKAMFDVNGSYDEVYEKFFKYYYGTAGETMRIIFDEVINNVNFLADNYGRGSSYNPDSHASEASGTYYYDGSISINCHSNYTDFWNNTGDCYNGKNGSCNGKNLANIPYWITLANQAVSLTENGDATIAKHVQRDVIFVYYCDYEINGTTTYINRITDYCANCGTYWANETDMRLDAYNYLDGTNTIIYKLTGRTIRNYINN